MNGLPLQDRIMEAAVIMNAALINLRLYPPTNALIVNTVIRLQESLEALLAEQDPVTLGEWEQSLLVCGEPLTPKNRERPQVAIILMLMGTWGIKEIGFRRGIAAAELSSFLELLGRKSGTVDREGWWAQANDPTRMPHIAIQRKIYMDRSLDALGAGLSEEALAALLTAANDPETLSGIEKLRQLASDDPGWLSKALHAGVEQLKGQGGTASSPEVSARLFQMLRSLDAISDPGRKEALSQQVAHELAGLDDGLVAELMQHDTTGLLDDRLFERIVEEVDCGRIETVMGLLQQQADSDPNGQARQALNRLRATDKGTECTEIVTERQTQETQERDRRLREIQRRWEPFFAGLDEGRRDPEAAAIWPGAVNGLMVEGETVAADWLIGQLVRRLGHDGLARETACHLLARLMRLLTEPQVTDLMADRQEELLSWLGSETVWTDAGRTIAERLALMARQALRERRLADSLPVVAALRRGLDRSVAPGTDGPAATLLDGLAAADILSLLLEEFRTDGTQQRETAGRHLVLMDRQALSSLLDLLRDSESTEERVRVLNLIPEIGPAAAPSLVARLAPDAAWYDLRNLARLLGRVGGEAEAASLAPLLGHEDPRVQREALKGISGIGGARRAEILLAALPLADDRIKAAIAAALGTFKHQPAVRPLIDLFHAKSAMSAELKADLQEKICLALGMIGSREALPLLTEIDRSGGLFTFKSYPPKVKDAAARSLALLTAKG